MIAIIDYGLGNLGSVKNALDTLHIESTITSNPHHIARANGIIFPGVGAAGEGMKNLKRSGLDEVIREEVTKNKPLLGICLGMQLLFSYSEENNVECLDIIQGTVKKFQINFKVPHIGWNEVRIQDKQNLFKNIPDKSFFYFVHSYYCEPKNTDIMVGSTNYQIDFSSAIQKDNVYATQFHPEKSSQAGLQLLKNFSLIITNNMSSRTMSVEDPGSI